MEIKVFGDTVEVHWLGRTEVTDNEFLVSMYKNADKQERKRLTVNFFDTKSFRVIAEDEPKKNREHKGLTTENYHDLVRYLQDDDLGNEDNPHWIVE